jgi:hypothetical protein
MDCLGRPRRFRSNPLPHIFFLIHVCIKISTHCGPISIDPLLYTVIFNPVAHNPLLPGTCSIFRSCLVYKVSTLTQFGRRISVQCKLCSRSSVVVTETLTHIRNWARAFRKATRCLTFWEGTYWEAFGIVILESFGTSDYGTFFGMQCGSALGTSSFWELFGMCIPKVFGN